MLIGLIQKPIDLGRQFRLYGLAVDGNRIRLRIYFCTKLSNNLTINGNAPVTDPLLRLAAARYPQLGQPFL